MVYTVKAAINDPVADKRYTDAVPAIIGQFGSRVLARGGDFRILEGPGKFHRIVVIEFAALDDAEACWKSDAYQKAASNRRDGAAAVFDMVRSGAVRVEISQRPPLAEIVDVHKAFEAGKTTGSTILMP